MTIQQMKNLEKCLSTDRYSVDIYEGRVFSNYYGKEKEIGYQQNIGGFIQWKIVLSCEGKRYFFQLGEIIAYLVGMFDGVENPEKYLVTIVNHFVRPHLHNIQLKKWSELGIKHRFRKE